MIYSKNGQCLVSYKNDQSPWNDYVNCKQGRVKDLQQKRVLDDAARRRRQRKALEALESDNFQDDPHADLKMSKKAPKFEESMEAVQQQGSGTKRQRKSRSDHFKFRYKKSFAALLEEDFFLDYCNIYLQLHMCTVWCKVLLCEMFGDTPRYKVFEMDSLRSDLGTTCMEKTFL
ncbi:VPS71 [Mytilus edulis]|uniref:ZNHIT1 n=1 Tax=Mytilus edulis TaxID=6550 RepID=A0A8S3TTC6_MYTED|nr:VPS71 [Mytilus edulis]